MLRVTPLYGSRWETSGAARSGSCTLVEYADVRVLVDVGLRSPASISMGKSATENTADEQNNNNN
eukprot:CAMPEP_0172373662 /NCGR_PEP_ID=MMETSP1060-20121228/52731_1 /TAXON_ID=37318 /ORGANISM="Pseudo-nitzschia pungens, Strain cf. cingulata" /LENGTH=64 /DNA_ID=CAMNT_0013100057 /DNA_START=30 /DNA_END=221 /DNA_ORIENTATION=+